ncbi:MAG: hypothetical protein H6811_08795 [Phycisphaeraceae bacterium]|nr:hypothetical protein [Phycisphaeraceae bacterium]
MGRPEEITPEPRERRGARRKIIIVVAVALSVLAVVVAVFGPAIGGAIARRIVQGRINRDIAGSVHIDGVVLTWTGEQRLEGLVLRDPEGAVVAEVSGSVRASLIDLILGSRNLSEMKLTGSADLVERADGSLNLRRALAPRRKRPALPPSPLPKGLRAALRLSNIDVTYTRESGDGSSSAFGLRGIEGLVDVSVLRPIEIKVTMETAHSAGVGPALRDAGTIVVDVMVENWIDSLRIPTPHKAVVRASVGAKGLSMEAADRLIGWTSGLAGAIGPRLDLDLGINGSGGDWSVTTSGKGAFASIQAGARVSGDGIETTRPLQLSVDLLGALAAAPPLTQAVHRVNGAVRFDDRPSLTLRLDDARLPFSGGLPTLTGARFAASGAVSPGIARAMREDLRFGTLELRPATFSLRLGEDSSASATFNASSVIDGQAGGEVAVSAGVERLLDDRGEVSIDPMAIAGTVGVTGLSTSVVQMWSDPEVTNLEEDVGPTVDLSIAVTPDVAGGRSIVDLGLDALHADLSGLLALTRERLSLAGDPIEFSLSPQASSIARLLQEGSLIEVTRAGGVTGSISDLSIPLEVESLAELVAGASARLTLGVSGAAVSAGDGEARAFELRSGTLVAALTPDGPATVSLQSTLANGGEAFGATISAQIARPGEMVGAGAVGDGSIRFDLTDVPASIVGALGLEVQGHDGEPADVSRIASQAAGARVNLGMGVTRVGETTGFVGEFRSPRLAVALDASLSGEVVSVSRLDLGGELSPGLMRSIVETFAPPMEPRPRLEGSTRYTLSAEGFSVDLSGERARPTTPIRAALTMERADLRGLGIRLDEDQTRFYGPVIVDEARGALTLDFGDGGGRPDIDISLSALARDGDGAPVGRLATSLGLARDGGLRGTADLSEANAAWFDRLTGRPGLVAEALGSPFHLGAGVERAGGATSIRAELASPRFSTDGPVGLTLTEESARVSNLKADWTIDPAWIAARTPDFISNRLELEEPAPVRIQVDAATFSKGKAIPSELKGRIDAPALSFRSGSHVERFSDVHISMTDAPRNPNALRFEAGLRRAGDAAAESGSTSGLTLSGVVRRPTPQDEPGPDTARLDLQFEATDAPVALLDAMLGQSGMLTDLVGESASATLQTRNLSSTTGRISGSFRSARASVALGGRVRDGLFLLDIPQEGDPAQVSVSQTLPSLSGRISRFLPLIGTVEKRSDDPPAMVRITRLEVPTDGDLSRMNGQFVVDVGAAHFKASSIFGRLMRIAEWDSGIGRNVEAIPFTIESGVLSFPRVKLPVSEFTIEMRGSVDISKRGLDVVTYVPLGALSEEVASRFRLDTGRILSGLGGLVPSFERLTYVPIRTTGSMDDPKTAIDLELFVKETVTETLQPGQILRQGVRDIFRLLPGG